MGAISAGNAHADANLAEGTILATVEIPASRDRVFRALSSTEITEWWVRPGVFDTRKWTGDVRVGGAWRASGMARGRQYVLEGEFVEVDSPQRLGHTWRLGGAPVGQSTTVTYLLEPVDGGTRLTMRHSGFTSPETCEATAIGWQTSFDRLAQILTSEHG